MEDEEEDEEEEEDVEPERRWEMERESIAMANMSAELQVLRFSSNSSTCCYYYHAYYYFTLGTYFWGLTRRRERRGAGRKRVGRWKVPGASC